MADDGRTRHSAWIRFVQAFLLWTAGRAVFFVVLRETDPNYRMAVDAGYGPAMVTTQLAYAVIGSGAAVAIYLRKRFAFMMATGALALYTGLAGVGILHTAANLPAAREVYKASREARVGLTRRWRRVKRWIPIALVLIVITALVVWLRVRVVPLESIVRGGDGPPTLVLLHGYGSNAEDWLPFAETIRVPPNGRFIFPQGPWRGPGDARGWWWLDIEGHIPTGGTHPDFSNASPVGITVASNLVQRFLADVTGPVILGGFSQGAMLSAEIAFQSDQPLAGLVLIAGTTVHESRWVERSPGGRDLPIFIAHGRRDPVLSFAIADRFRTRLQAAGLDVTWFPYDGGHEIPAEVVRELNGFLAKAR